METWNWEVCSSSLWQTDLLMDSPTPSTCHCKQIGEVSTLWRWPVPSNSDSLPPHCSYLLQTAWERLLHSPPSTVRLSELPCWANSILCHLPCWGMKVQWCCLPELLPFCLLRQCHTSTFSVIFLHFCGFYHFRHHFPSSFRKTDLTVFLGEFPWSFLGQMKIHSE